MTMKPENEPTDEQLDAMLRDVQIPTDLKPRLKRVPEPITATEEAGRLSQTTPLLQPTVPTQAIPAQRSSARAPWLSYALAALA